MALTLQHFDTTINNIIVNRGEDYFLDGLVQEFEIHDNNLYTAEISGSSVYKVRVNLKKDKILEYSCTCPYDLGPVCKHVVAVLYAIRSSQEEPDQRATPTRKRKKNKAKTQEQKMNEIFAKVTYEELQEYITNLITTRRLTRRDFITVSYTHLTLPTICSV